MNILKQEQLTKLPVLKIKGSVIGNRILGNNVHDTYVLGKDGGLHYLNIQGMIGTEYGELEFEVDDGYERTFKSWNFIELMDHDAKRLGIEEEEEYKETRKKIKNIFIKAMKNNSERQNKIMMEVLKQHFEEFEGKREESKKEKLTMNKKPFEVRQSDLDEEAEEFKEGQLVLYEGTFGFEIGKIKKLKGKRRAYVWYHSGDTAALTDFEFLKPIINDYCIQDLINKKASEEREEQE